MYFCDTHIHLPEIKTQSLQTFLQTAEKIGIVRFISVSAKPEDWSATANVATKHPEKVTPAFAVHPWYVNNLPDNWQEKLEQMIAQHPQALIGECGFDRLHDNNRERQQEVFDFHIQMSQKHHRALLLHMVKADAWLEAYWQRLPEKFVFHSFGGNPELLKKIVKYGGYVALNAKILNKNKAEEILRALPPERLLLESDAPYQTRVETIPDLCKKIALIQGIKVEVLAQQIYANTLEIMKNDR